MKKTLLIIPICITIFSCSNDSEDDLTDTNPPQNTVTYLDNVKSIIDNNCISCHSSPPQNGAPMSLMLYTDVKDAVLNRDLIGRITGAGSGSLMPLGGPKLPQNLIDIILKWEADGLLEN